MRANILCLLLLPLPLAGCGGTTTAKDMAQGTADLAVGPDLAAPPDLAPPNDLTMVVGGKKLADGKATMVGVTSDSFAVFIDENKGNNPIAKAAPSGGGTVQKIVEQADQSTVWVDGKVVFAWHDSDQNGDGPLTVWTAASGAKELSTFSPNGYAAASADGAWIAWLDNYKNDAADLVIDKADHSAPKVVLKQINLSTDECLPSLDFAGARVVISHCDAMGSVTVTSFDTAGTGVVLLAKASTFWESDKAGTMVLVTTVGEVGSVVPVAGGAPLVSNLANLVYGEFTPDGSAIVYITSAGGLYRVPTKGGAPTVLQAKDVENYDDLSPDGKFILFHKETSPDDFTDLLLASATQAGAPITLAAMPTAATGTWFGDSFTSDGSRALYFTDCDPTEIIGTLTAKPTSGGMATVIAPNTASVFAGVGARVVYTGNYVPIAMEVGRGDLLTLDLAKGGAPSLLATQVNLDFGLTPDKKTVIYAYQADLTRAGVYALALP
ncbi:MAG: hypothetical protein EXR72_15320 [Myxococcales bacterium]|nr:hypothetical protein [Myxococcales bacterium]